METAIRDYIRSIGDYISNRMYLSTIKMDDRTFLIKTPERTSIDDNLFRIRTHLFEEKITNTLYGFNDPYDIKFFIDVLEKEIRKIDNEKGFTNNSLPSYQAAINKLQKEVDFDYNSFVLNIHLMNDDKVKTVKELKFVVEQRVIYLGFLKLFLERSYFVYQMCLEDFNENILINKEINYA